MEIAKLVLEFVKALIWPVVMLFVLVFFRAETRDLFQRLRSLRSGIAEAEFAEQAAQARAESELAVVDVEPMPDTGLPFYDELMHAAPFKPEEAVQQAWQTVERQLEDVVVRLGLKRRMRGHVGPLNVDYVAGRLAVLGLPQPVRGALVDLWRAIAQIDALGVSSTGASDFVEACNNVYQQIAHFVISNEQAA
ncbi:hypothetical protein [Streptomyces sp. NPDC055056]